MFCFRENDNTWNPVRSFHLSCMIYTAAVLLLWNTLNVLHFHRDCLFFLAVLSKRINISSKYMYLLRNIFLGVPWSLKCHLNDWCIQWWIEVRLLNINILTKHLTNSTFSVDVYKLLELYMCFLCHVALWLRVTVSDAGNSFVFGSRVPPKHTWVVA